MSVLVPDVKVYEYIHNGLTIAANRRECDIWYSQSIYSHCRHYGDDEPLRLVKAWAELNELSYSARYKQKGDSLPEFINGNKHIDVNPYQLLKYLECVDYNIEITTIEEDGQTQVTPQGKQDHKLLRSWISDLQGAIINQIPAYQSAKWSEAI